MNETVEIWHNPKCSKSRKTLEILEGLGVKPTIRLYLNDPPSEQELIKVLETIPATELTRVKEALYSEISWSTQPPNTKELVHALSKHPILIERPLVITERGMVIGRPPERVHTLFSSD
jgi:arsenate reductase